MTVLLGLDREPGSALPLTHQLRFDAGSPGLNLLATVGQRFGPERAERMPTVARLRDWLAANGLPSVPVEAADLAAVHRLRTDGYDVLSAIAAGHRPDPAALQRLGDLAATPLPGPALAAGRGRVPRRVPPAPEFGHVLVGMARDLADAAVEHADRLRLCDSARCRVVYLDASPGGRRRWCSMDRCGNAAKAARHRARTAGASA